MHLGVHTTITNGSELDFMGNNKINHIYIKKTFKIYLLYTFMPFVCLSQNVQKFEGEASLGLTSPIGNYHYGEKRIGPDLGIEFRYNIPYTKWDCGVQVNATTSVFRFYDLSSDWYWDQSNRILNYLAIGDYNFKQGKTLNPFVGIGFGIGFFESINEVKYDNSGTSVVFKPRIGIEFFHHVRLTLFSSLGVRGFSNWGVAIGGVIGGRPKKYNFE